MQITNVRKNDTLEPKCTLHITEDDIKRMRKLIKKNPNREVTVELTDVSQIMKDLDEALIKMVGREQWEQSMRARIMPKKEEVSKNA